MSRETRYDPTPAGMVEAWKQADQEPSKKPEWTEREVVGGTHGELEVRSGKAERVILVTADSANQPNGDALIRPGEERRMTFTSAVAWAGIAFSVSSEHAHLFLLDSMQCAMMEFIPDEGIPCTLLSDAACVECRLPHVKRHLPTRWPVVLPGTHLTIMVKNVGDQPSHFRGTFEAESGPTHYPCL